MSESERERAALSAAMTPLQPTSRFNPQASLPRGLALSGVGCPPISRLHYDSGNLQGSIAGNVPKGSV